MLGAIGFSLVVYTALKVFDDFMIRRIDKASKAEADKFSLSKVFTKEEIRQMFKESEQL